MKAIVTKYHPVGYSRGSRYSATDADGNRVYSENRLELNSEQNHDQAARKLCQKLGWKGKLVRGDLAKGRTVYVWLTTYSVIDMEESAIMPDAAKRRDAHARLDEIMDGMENL